MTVLHATGCVDVNPRGACGRGTATMSVWQTRKLKFKAPEGFPLRSDKSLSFYKIALGQLGL